MKKKVFFKNMSSREVDKKSTQSTVGQVVLPEEHTERFSDLGKLNFQMVV